MFRNLKYGQVSNEREKNNNLLKPAFKSQATQIYLKSVSLDNGQ